MLHNNKTCYKKSEETLYNLTLCKLMAYCPPFLRQQHLLFSDHTLPQHTAHATHPWWCILLIRWNTTTTHPRPQDHISPSCPAKSAKKDMSCMTSWHPTDYNVMIIWQIAWGSNHNIQHSYESQLREVLDALDQWMFYFLVSFAGFVLYQITGCNLTHFSILCHNYTIQHLHLQSGV